MDVWRGDWYPLGATWTGAGTNFALFSEHATKVELCLFDAADATQERDRVVLPERTHFVWHGFLPEVRPGQLYGFRVHGPYEPEAGRRFNPHKIVLDPYARMLGRDVQWDANLFGYEIGHERADLSFDARDNAANAPLAMVVDGVFDWGDDRPLRTPWHRTVIYEAHVRGLTRLHPGVPEGERGTYAGLASPVMLAHFRELGVTAIELLPVHHHVDAQHLVERGLANYWGYDSLAFFAPHVRYARAQGGEGAVREFKAMVRSLHQAGLEVILDVVYNHTVEGNQLGPTLSLRGIDNSTYYRLAPDNARHYVDYTGCGNTLNMQSPRALQLIMDSLRYWVVEMHVDGFRFDLASALARELHEVDRLASFFDIIHQDPILSRVKLIAEPWDLGEGGYQVGNFPVLWTEWNGRYRDCIRRFWRGDPGVVSEFATRLCGSSDLYETSGRRPSASINFVTAHDGFSLHDLVSYEHKHNERNGEEDRDGTNHNLSWNCGAEGPTDCPEIEALRRRQVRNLLATLFLSQGVPMICSGDEIGHTKLGNNNSYCQDNEINWLCWELDENRRALLAFVQRMTRLRRELAVLQRRKFFQGRPIRGSQVRALSWYDSAGREMTEEAWTSAVVGCLAVRLDGSELEEWDEHCVQIRGDTIAILFNAHAEPIEFTLPPATGGLWQSILDTAADTEHAVTALHDDRYLTQPRSVVLCRLTARA